jgi:hypothetical protein
LTWYAEAMRLWKRGPAMHALLAAFTILSQVALELWPDAGALVSKVVVPLVACGMLYAAHASAQGGKPRMVHAVAAFRASAAAIGAIVVSSALTFAAEWVAADRLAGVDLLRPGAAQPELDAWTVLGVYAVGVLASLPMSLVPLYALFDGAGFAESFARSARAFVRHLGAFLAYGVVAFVLIALGLMTMGLGLVIALPLIACATYAAWRDLQAATPTDAGESP